MDDSLVVNAVFGLRDMLSQGLGRIQKMLGSTATQAAGLTTRMGNLALAMAPVAVAVGALLLAFGSCTQAAIAFESSMADVGKVVNFETQAEMQHMSDTILEMSGRIPMAADGIAAIIASAAQSGIAKESLSEFAEQAAKMGVAFDLTGDIAGKMMADWRAGMALPLPRVYALADAVNHLSNNMNAQAPALGEVIQRVGALAMSCGLGETQVAALGAAFLSAGASPEIASTALKKFTSTMVKGEAMSKRGKEAFASLGLSVTQMAKDMQTDAKGTIFSVLESLANKPKELQMSLLTEMFGEEAIGAIAPLLANMGNLTQAFNLVGDASDYAGSMQAEFDTRSKTTENTLQLLRNRFTALSITIGNAFLPFVNSAANAVSGVIDTLRGLFATPVGQWVLRVVAGLGTAILALTAFAGVVWGLGAAMPFLSKGFAVLKGALLGLGWPFWALVAAGAALYLAWENNFGGIANTLTGWYNTTVMVCQGVMSVFSTLVGGHGEIRGELAEKIEAAGLVGVVTTISKVVNRFKWFFKAAFMQVQEHFFAVQGKLSAVFERLGNTFSRVSNIIGKVVSRLFGGSMSGAITSSTSAWFTFGQAAGNVVNWLIDVAVFALESVALYIELLVSGVELLCAVFSGDFVAAGNIARGMLDTIKTMFSNLLDILPFGLGDTLRGIFTNAVAVISSFDLTESSKKIIGTLIDGVLSMKDSLVNSVTDVFSEVREYLPFSDAKKGPFSDLTTSGAAIISTLGLGASSASGGFTNTIGNVFNQAATLLSQSGLSLPSLFGADIPALGPAVAMAGSAPQCATVEGRAAANNKGTTASKTFTIQNLNVTLPDVKDGQSFVDSLKNFVEQYDAE